MRLDVKILIFQLKLKTEKLDNMMKLLEKEMVKMSKGLSDWCEKQKSLHNGYICAMEPFKTANKTDGYRNRCEFTIGA